MKVITIKQPFATLIAEGYKEYEFRKWKTNYRGDILIHAGKTIDKEAVLRFKEYNLEYPVGCIIAKASLTDCVPVTDEFKEILRKKNSLVYSRVVNENYNDRYGFKMENVKKIDPIYINGQLGLWNYEKSTK